MTVNDKISDYITFPRTFEKYGWYKPILVLIITLIIMAVIQGLLILFTSLTFGTEYTRFLFSGGIDSLNSAMPVIFGDLIILIFISSLYIASKIVKDRPFSSYSSS